MSDQYSSADLVHVIEDPVTVNPISRPAEQAPAPDVAPATHAAPERGGVRPGAGRPASSPALAVVPDAVSPDEVRTGLRPDSPWLKTVDRIEAQLADFATSRAELVEKRATLIRLTDPDADLRVDRKKTRDLDVQIISTDAEVADLYAWLADIKRTDAEEWKAIRRQERADLFERQKAMAAAREQAMVVVQDAAEKLAAAHAVLVQTSEELFYSQPANKNRVHGDIHTHSAGRTRAMSAVRMYLARLGVSWAVPEDNNIPLHTVPLPVDTIRTMNEAVLREQFKNIDPELHEPAPLPQSPAYGAKEADEEYRIQNDPVLRIQNLPIGDPDVGPLRFGGH